MRGEPVDAGKPSVASPVDAEGVATITRTWNDGPLVGESRIDFDARLGALLESEQRATMERRAFVRTLGTGSVS